MANEIFKLMAPQGQTCKLSTSIHFWKIVSNICCTAPDGFDQFQFRLNKYFLYTFKSNSRSLLFSLTIFLPFVLELVRNLFINSFLGCFHDPNSSCCCPVCYIKTIYLYCSSNINVFRFMSFTKFKHWISFKAQGKNWIRLGFYVWSVTY